MSTNALHEYLEQDAFEKAEVEEVEVRIQMGMHVDYQREGYRFFNGLVTTLDESTDRALVFWTDSLGQGRETYCGVEYLQQAAGLKSAPIAQSTIQG